MSMSKAYDDAITRATMVLMELGPKIDAKPGQPVLTPEEGTRFLNSQWEVYLYALAAGEWEEAATVTDFNNLLSLYLKILGYSVEFTDAGKYCVSATQKGN